MSNPSGKAEGDILANQDILYQAKLAEQIRRNVRAALPAPAEQFFTLMVPGKVLNLDDYAKGFDTAGKATTIVPLTSVEIAEAKLCDEMPALSGIQLGPTGRSVARSYSATLSKLVPTGTTIGIDDNTVRSVTALDDDQKRYKMAMDWLTKPDPQQSSKTPVQVYTEKLAAYTTQVEEKTKAFQSALQLANDNPKNTQPAQRAQEYDDWVQTNARHYRTAIQGAYMDLVTTGRKEQVEYWFAVVDNDSALSRVEASKESMRNTTVIDEVDGSTEWPIVSLTPSNWAWLAQQKINENPGLSEQDSLLFQIGRLQKINILLTSLYTHPDKIPAVKPAQNADVTAAITTAQTNADLLVSNDQDLTSQLIERTAETTPAAKPPVVNLQTLSENLKGNRTDLAKDFLEIDKKNVATLSKAAVDAQDNLKANTASKIQDRIQENQRKIKDLQNRLDQLTSVTDNQALDALQERYAASAGIPAAPLPASPAGTPATADFWTTISVQVSSGYDAEQSNSSANSFSAGASAGWGLWSVGGGASHSDATSDFAKQTANCDVSITFDCMRVDITRPWLRPELFRDSDLTIANVEKAISPGASKLVELLDPTTYGSTLSRQQIEAQLEQYNLFPMYPTAFLMAANVVLDIQGETGDIATHFHTSTTSGSASVGWGPFAVHSSFSHTDTQQSSTCETTATGCRITIKSPQIIGWISEIVPALPRLGQVVA